MECHYRTSLALLEVTIALTTLPTFSITDTPRHTLHLALRLLPLLGASRVVGKHDIHICVHTRTELCPISFIQKNVTI